MKESEAKTKMCPHLSDSEFCCASKCMMWEEWPMRGEDGKWVYDNTDVGDCGLKTKECNCEH